MRQTSKSARSSRSIQSACNVTAPYLKSGGSSVKKESTSALDRTKRKKPTARKPKSNGSIKETKPKREQKPKPKPKRKGTSKGKGNGKSKRKVAEPAPPEPLSECKANVGGTACRVSVAGAKSDQDLQVVQVRLRPVAKGSKWPTSEQKSLASEQEQGALQRLVTRNWNGLCEKQIPMTYLKNSAWSYAHGMLLAVDKNANVAGRQASKADVQALSEMGIDAAHAVKGLVLYQLAGVSGTTVYIDVICARGSGGVLMRAAHSMASRLRAQFITLLSLPASMPFYSKLQFRLTGPSHGDSKKLSAKQQALADELKRFAGRRLRTVTDVLNDEEYVDYLRRLTLAGMSDSGPNCNAMSQLADMQPESIVAIGALHGGSGGGGKGRFVFSKQQRAEILGEAECANLFWMALDL